MEITGTVINNQIELYKRVWTELDVDNKEIYLYENTIKTRGPSNDSYGGHHFLHCRIINSNSNEKNIDCFWMKTKYPDSSYIGYLSILPLSGKENIVEDIREGRNDIDLMVYIDDKNYGETLNLISKKNKDDIIQITFNTNRFDASAIKESLVLPVSSICVHILTKEINEIDILYDNLLPY